MCSGVTLHLMSNRPMAFNLKTIRKAKGVSQEQLAEALDILVAQVSRLESGRSDVSLSRLQQFADFLGCNVTDLISEEVSDESIAVRGHVQAGDFQESSEWDPEFWYHVKVPIPDQWKPYPKFGLEVRGPSMNRKYPEGTILVCVRILDIDLEPEPGHRYIVQTERAGEFETTVKELKIDDEGRAWLWPDSDHPEHSTPLQIGGDDDFDTTVQIIAIVIASYQPE